MPILKVGTISEDKRNLYKSPTWRQSNLKCYIKDGRSIINPIFILDYKPEYTQCNYAYVEEWGRYYFIDNIVLAPGGKAELSCSVDVLQTYQNFIQNLTVNVVRQEELYEPYLPDAAYTYLDTYDVINKLGKQRSVQGAVAPDLFGNTNEYTYSYVLGVSGNFNNHYYDIPGYGRITTDPGNWSEIYLSCFVNRGSVSSPQMMSIRTLIGTGEVTDAQARDFDYMYQNYDLYYKKVE